MKSFFISLTETRWGIIVICIFSAALLIFLSCALYRQFFKRFYDVVLSFTAIIVFSPLLILLMISGSIAMRGNPFFVQKRPGKKDRNGNEKIFSMIKFRTMSNKKDAYGNLLPDEMRLNKYGKFLRSSSLDELSELFNILKGDMSIVGPRPQLVKDMYFMSDEQRNRHNVRPGLTGLAQVNGRNSVSWEDKLKMDLEYVNDISFFKDVAIVFKTFFKVIKRSGVVREGTVSDIDYGDWLLSRSEITKEEYDEKLLKAKKRLSEDKKQV